MGLGDDSNRGTGSVMWDGSWGEAEAPSDRKTCHIRRWSGVQLKPGFKPEFCPCVTLGNLLNLSERRRPCYHRHEVGNNAYLSKFS